MLREQQAAIMSLQATLAQQQQELCRRNVPAELPTTPSPPATVEDAAAQLDLKTVVVQAIITAAAFVSTLSWRIVIERFSDWVVFWATSGEDATQGKAESDVFASAAVASGSPDSIRSAALSAGVTTLVCLLIIFIAVRCVRPFFSRVSRVVSVSPTAVGSK